MKITGPIPAAALLGSGASPLIIAHRGDSGAAPENTLPSFRQALAAGADFVEMDYWHSQDGVPMVFHDAALDRTTDSRKKFRRAGLRVADLTSAEIRRLDAGSWFGPAFAGAKVPRVAEALDRIAARGGRVVLERKSGDAKTCAELLRGRRLTGRVVVISFEWAFLAELHRAEPRLVLGALGPPARSADGRPVPAEFRRPGPAALNAIKAAGAAVVVWNRSVAPESILLIHRHRLKLWVYTVDDPKLARRLRDRGVDGIITNRIARIRRALGIGSTA